MCSGRSGKVVLNWEDRFVPCPDPDKEDAVMSLDSLDQSLKKEIDDLQAEGRAKNRRGSLRAMCRENGHGPRYLLHSGKREFLRLELQFLSLCLLPSRPD